MRSAPPLRKKTDEVNVALGDKESRFRRSATTNFGTYLPSLDFIFPFFSFFLFYFLPGCAT